MSSPLGLVYPDAARNRATIGILRLLAAASIAVPVLVLACGGWIAWEQKRQEAFDETTHLLQLVTDSSAKLFDSQLLALEQTKLLLRDATDADVRANEERLHDNLSFTRHYLPFLRDLFVVDRNGVPLVTASRYPAPKTPLIERDYFRYFRDGHGGRFIGERAERYVNGEPFIPMAIARPSLDGSFNGIIACSLNPNYIKQYFQQLLSMYSDTEGRSIALRRNDGQLLVRSGDLTQQQEHAERLSAVFITDRTQAVTGYQISNVLGGNRIVAWARLPSLGMVAWTSISLDGVMHAWLRSMIPYAVLCVASALSLLALSGVALRRTEASIVAEQHAAAERERREQAEEAVRQSQKMEALGKLTGGVAHDFNNLLAVIQGNAELAKSRNPDKAARMLDNIVHAAQRGATLTRQLLSFSRGQALAPRPIDPRVELPRVIAMLRPSLRGNIQVDVTIDDDVWPLELDPGEWEIALLNIAVNARDAMPNGGRLSVTARNVRLSRGEVPAAPELSGAFVRLTLRDTGSGIPPDIAARAFEPFFTTKDVGRGTGLGLSQVYGFARQAGGAAMIGPAPEGGTAVTLLLPRALRVPGPRPNLVVPDSNRPDEAGARRILFVEDNQEVAAITADIIRTLGYEVVHVDRARKALEILIGAQSAFHLLITDVVMPDGMDGVQLAQEVRRRLPSLPIILVSGYNEAGAAEATGLRLLRKPLPAQQLAQAIEAELGTFPRIVVDNTRVG
ncbi:MAG TPA: response regulator [Rhodopila sp.]|uniref:hybrid sensor histidine kinase/response regulator n=1 Tax=Rhodopila sp. TaxID=2480087 RepID=UPI002D01F5AF|nr:response regulator [Rhodopila sp.]HVY14284.1 response regulator [Rhodopila sp.]